MKPICIKCQCEFTCAKNGVLIHTYGPEYWSGDKWECPKCGYEIVSGFAQKPHFVDDEELAKSKFKPLVAVDFQNPL